MVYAKKEEGQTNPKVVVVPQPPDTLVFVKVAGGGLKPGPVKILNTTGIKFPKPAKPPIIWSSGGIVNESRLLQIIKDLESLKVSSPSEHLPMDLE